MRIFWKKKVQLMNRGTKGEELAADYLKDKGYSIRARNFKNSRGRQLGEIDIIAEKDKEIVFVEVKTRAMERYSDTLPEENITPAKLHRLSKIAVLYIQSHNLWDRPYRFDGVSVWLSDDFKKINIKHIESMFR